jgi:non-specific protein-tyrosine kinase
MEQMKNSAEGTIPQVHPVKGLDAIQSYSSEPDAWENVRRVSYRAQAENPVLCSSERDRAGLERFKLLRYRLYQLREQRAMRSILVTSAIPREGKSMVAVNLAATLAQASDRVLLVDADLRRPSLDSFLGLKPTEGLADFLQGRVELLSACWRVDPLGFVFLNAGHSPANPVELLQGESMRGLLKTAATTFDWVVIDSPPVLPLADARFLATLCDAAIMVAREGHTRREELREGLAALKGTYLAGIVFNTSQTAIENAYSYLPPSELPGEIVPPANYMGGHAARTQVVHHG